MIDYFLIWKVTVFPTYTLPPLGDETIVATSIPAICLQGLSLTLTFTITLNLILTLTLIFLQGTLDIDNQAGVYSLNVVARIAYHPLTPNP